MYYREMAGVSVSALGMGNMRLPKIEGQGEKMDPRRCVGCGACASICPQGIAIPKIMREFAGMLAE